MWDHHDPRYSRDQIVAVISLASLKKYSKEHLEILNQVQNGINTIFSNIQATDNIKKLVSELNVKNQELEAQAEELQSQSEELQQQNIELETQRHQVMDANRLKKRKTNLDIFFE